MNEDTIPSVASRTERRAQIAPSVTDPTTGARYVHKDLVEVAKPWAEREHIPPVKIEEKFGDAPSWARYVERFGSPTRTNITWNSQGIKAVLDYHAADGTPGRCQWVASLPYEITPEFKAWQKIGDGKPVAHSAAIEALEDHQADIQTPDATTLLNILRAMRANVKAEAQTELRPDGTASVSFSSDRTVASKGTVEIPPVFVIQIPVLKGMLNTQENPLKYALSVRVRADVAADAKLALRFLLQDPERVLEAVCKEQAFKAGQSLAGGHTILRAA